MLNTYPCNPFPISSEQLHKGDNEDLQAQINAIKDGTVIDSFGDVETALDTKADNDVIAQEFDAEAGTYEIGDKVMYEGKLYEFTSAHETAGEWDPTEVTETTVADELSSLESGLTNVQNAITPIMPSSDVTYIPFGNCVAITGSLEGNDNSSLPLGIPTNYYGVVMGRFTSTGKMSLYYVDSGYLRGWDGTTNRTFPSTDVITIYGILSFTQ